MFSRMMMSTIAVTVALPAMAHHSVLNYDGKVEVTITGVVTKRTLRLSAQHLPP